MRVPWSIVLLLGLLVVGSTWHFSTRHYDFLSPRGVTLPPLTALPDRIHRDGNEVPFSDSTPLENKPRSISPRFQVTDKHLGDLGRAPGLAEYRDFAALYGPQATFALSSRLQALGEEQRARLAMERVIDSARPLASPVEMAQAVAGAFALSRNLSPWSVDPSAEHQLQLTITANRRPGPGLRTAARILSSQIREASDSLVQVTPELIGTPTPSPDTPPGMTLQFSHADRSTPIITARGPFPDESTALDELSRATFLLVRNLLSTKGYAPTPDHVTPRDLSEGMTRLMWQDFALSLIPASQPVPSLPSAHSSDHEEES